MMCLCGGSPESIVQMLKAIYACICINMVSQVYLKTPNEPNLSATHQKSAELSGNGPYTIGQR